MQSANLQIPQPEGNKGTQSGREIAPSPFALSTDLHNLQNLQVQNEGVNNFAQFAGLHLADLTPEQLSQLGMFRDGKGDYFHVSNTEDGGYRLSPTKQESVAGVVAGIQRQAQRAQQNQQSALLKKIFENAVDQFQVNIRDS